MQRVSPIFALGLTDADIVSEKFLKRVLGRTDLEDGIKKLDKLTNEEVAMASAQFLKIAHKIDNNLMMVEEGVMRVDEGVTRVDENVLVVKSEVQVVNDNIKVVDDKVQTMADGGQHLFSRRYASYLTPII